MESSDSREDMTMLVPEESDEVDARGLHSMLFLDAATE
jgi:hypothetical protein